MGIDMSYNKRWFKKALKPEWNGQRKLKRYNNKKSFDLMEIAKENRKMLVCSIF